MRSKISLFIQVVIFGLIAFQLSSCKKCEPYIKSSILPETQKEFISQNLGDTLNFVDENKKQYYLVCTLKALRGNGGGSYGHANPCDDSSISWEFIQANFSGNLISDKGDSIKLHTFVGGQPTETDPDIGFPACGYFGLNQLKLKFQAKDRSQWAVGFTDESVSPKLGNFHYSLQKSLNGKVFQEVNAQSISKPGIETTCTSKVIPEVGIDSIYYSKQYGLIRYTTVGGKKYQRIL